MFCKNCGKEIADDVKFCDGCGAAVEAAGETTPPEPQVKSEQTAPPPPPPPQQTAPVVPQTPYIPPSSQPNPAATTDNTKLFSILAYLGILFVVGLVAEPNNPKVKFHVNQGCILFIAEMILWVVVAILSSILPFLGAIFSLAQAAFVIGFSIIGIMNVVNGQEKPLPYIGNYTIIK